MKTPQRVVWSEGMFLGPQHMQQADRYHEALLAARLEAISPYDWGVLSLDLDPRELDAARVKVQQFTGVFPDGLPLAFESNHPLAPPPRLIEEHFPPTARSLEVFLAVPSEREGAANFASGKDAFGQARFTSVLRRVSDLTGAGGEVPVAMAQCNLSLLFGDEVREGYDAIKIAEIVRGTGGAFTLRDNYIPPCRRISVCAWLMTGLRRLLGQMVARQRTLSDERRQQDAQSVEYGPQEVTRFLLLGTLSAAIPVLAHMVDSPTSPESAYLYLCQLAGQLGCFHPDADPTRIPRFVFTDLNSTFEPLLNLLMGLLQATTREGFLLVPLSVNEEGMMFAQIEDERLLRATNYVLAVRSELPDAQLIDRLPKLSKIASWGDIPSIVYSAMPGVPLKVLLRPPQEIPIRPGIVYFSLITSDRFWLNIVSERTIGIYVPPPLDPKAVQYELYAILPTAR